MGNFVKNVAPLGFNHAARARTGGQFNKDTGIWTFAPQEGGGGDIAFTNADMFSVTVRCTYLNKSLGDAAKAAGFVPVCRIINGSAQLSTADMMMWQTGGKVDLTNGSSGFGSKEYMKPDGSTFVIEYSIPVMVGVQSPNYLVVACADNVTGWGSVTSLEVVCYEVTGLE